MPDIRWLFCVCFIVSVEGQLRHRRSLQETAQGVAPRCRPGYQDVTNGQAYDWACAFHCPGGAYATAQCGCACLSPSQIDRLGIIQPAPPSARGTDLLLTSTPEPSREPSPPIIEAPIGGLGSPDQELEPPRVNDFVVEGATTTTQPEEEQQDSFTDLVIISCSIVLLSGSAAIVAVAVWGGFRKSDKTGRKKQQAKTQPLTLPMHLPVEKVPEPPRIEDTPKHPALAVGAGEDFASRQRSPEQKDMVSGQEDMDELELSSVITRGCDAKELSTGEAKGPIFEAGNEPLSTRQKLIPPAVKISQVHPVA